MPRGFRTLCICGGKQGRHQVTIVKKTEMGIQFDYDKVLAAAMSTGGDYADIFVEHSTFSDITLRDSSVNSAGNHIDCGTGIRVLKGDRTGYAYTESMEFSDIMRAARVAAGIADSSASYNPVPVCVSEPKGWGYYPLSDAGDRMLSIERKMQYLYMLDDFVFSSDEKVDKVLARISDSITEVDFVNTQGCCFHDVRPMLSVVSSCVMRKGSRVESNSSSRSFRAGGGMLTEGLIREVADECVSRTSLLFDAVQPKGGEMPVVMGAGGSGILLHEAIGHAFEADFNRKGASIFSDKMGKRICRDFISVADDATIMFNRGAVNFDDEGVPGEKTYMVKNGILTSYLHDRISARFYGVRPTGNGRRESFRFMPLPRMRATYMENGKCSEEELIRDVKYGVYADNFSNGQVQIGAGDFTFYVKSGYLIENGKLTSPVKDINIIGNGPAALASIVGVADNLKLDNGTWTCGKEQQSCPVCCGMPSALVEKLTVGGVN